MRATSVLQALRDRLGHDATIGLLEFVSAEQAEWSDRVLTVGVERFERRLAEELATLRVALVQEIHDGKVQTIRWTFMFWAGQMTAFMAVLALLLRIVGR
jgi:hypothetical protein